MDCINLCTSDQVVNFSSTFGTCELFTECISGGFLEGKKDYAWLLESLNLKIVSIKSGQVIFSSPVFQSDEFESRLETSHSFNMIEYGRFLGLVFRITGGNMPYSILVIYSLRQNRITNCIKIFMEVVSMSHLPKFVCSKAIINEFDGMAVLGTQSGEVLLLDLQLKKRMDSGVENLFTILENPSNCSIYKYNLPSTELRKLFQNKNEEEHLAIKIKITETAVSSLFFIKRMKILALGSIFGDLILFDLGTMSVFYSFAHADNTLEAPLIKIEYIEPADDPCPCFYLWGIFKKDKLDLKLYSVMFDKQYYEEKTTFAQAFRKCSLRFQHTLDDSEIKYFSSQTIYSTCTLKEEFVSCLFAFSWCSLSENRNQLLLFDLNQWYKDEMPKEVSMEHKPRYLSLFHLNVREIGLQTLMEPSSLAHYNSIYRSEEHFYPNSLSFDCILLLSNSCKTFCWEGMQNKIINKIKSSSCSIFVHPDSYVNDISEAGLVPQFVDSHFDDRYNEKYALEVILSFALENGCYHLLRDCINSCLHGTISGFNIAFMDWIWTRVSAIEKRCKLLCTGLFDARRSFVDLDTFQELDHLSKQLTFLSTLVSEIFQESKYKDDNIRRLKRLRIHSSFYSILVWMFNNNLLIKTERLHNKQILRLIEYSSSELEEKHKNRRKQLLKRINSYRSIPSESEIQITFIDLLIEKKIKSRNDQSLKEKLPFDRYPPKTLQEILNMFMVEKIHLKNKFTLFLYFLIDLIKINESIDLRILEQFATSFNIPEFLVTSTLCFWNLDNGFLSDAVNFFICMKNRILSHPKWSVDLMVEVLLAHNQPRLAIRILNTVPYAVSNKLKIETFLWSGLYNDAFQIVRAKDNSNELLLLFYNFLLKHSRYDIIYQLGLNDRETTLLHTLTSREATHTESLHLGYILQKLNLIDVLRFEDDNPKKQQFSEPSQNVVLSAFKSTIPAISQNVTDFYCSQRNKLKSTSLFEDIHSPLSCQLLKDNLLKDRFLYHSTVSSHFASNCCDNFHKDVLSTSSSLAFLRKPQDYMKYKENSSMEQISVPQIYKSVAKRSLYEIGELPPVNPISKKRKISKADETDESFLNLCHRSIQSKSSTLAEKDSLQGILKVKDSTWTVNGNDGQKNLRFDSFYRNENEISDISEELVIGENYLSIDSLNANLQTPHKWDGNKISKDDVTEKNSNSDVSPSRIRSVSNFVVESRQQKDSIENEITNCKNFKQDRSIDKGAMEATTIEIQKKGKKNQTPQAQERNYRSMSVPVNNKEISQRSNDSEDELGTRRKVRGSSVPPKAKVEKPKRTYSTEQLFIDSPASRTRSRTRLNSMESNIDSPINGSDEKRRSLTDLKDSTKSSPLCHRRRSLHNTPENDEPHDDLKNLEHKKHLTRNQVASTKKISKSHQSNSENYNLDTIIEEKEDRTSTHRLRGTSQHFLETIPETDNSETPTKSKRRSQYKK